MKLKIDQENDALYLRLDESAIVDEKDEKSALIDIALDDIRKEFKKYSETIAAFQKKYGCDYGHFTEQLQNRATIEAEEDWMAWKGAREMQQAWIDAKIKLSGNE